MSESETAFQRSIELLIDQDRYEAAKSYVAWSAARAAQGDGESAADLLKKARHIFRELGAFGELERIRPADRGANDDS